MQTLTETTVPTFRTEIKKCTSADGDTVLGDCNLRNKVTA